MIKEEKIERTKIFNTKSQLAVVCNQAFFLKDTDVKSKSYLESKINITLPIDIFTATSHVDLPS